MGAFLVKRIVSALVLVLVVSLVSFLLIKAPPARRAGGSVQDYGTPGSVRAPSSGTLPWSSGATHRRSRMMPSSPQP